MREFTQYNVDFANGKTDVSVRFIVAVPPGANEEAVEVMGRYLLGARLNFPANINDYRMVRCAKHCAVPPPPGTDPPVIGSPRFFKLLWGVLKEQVRQWYG